MTRSPAVLLAFTMISALATRLPAAPLPGMAPDGAQGPAAPTPQAKALASVPDAAIEAFYKASRLTQLAPSAIPADRAGRRRIFEDLVYGRPSATFLYATPADLDLDRAAARALLAGHGVAEASLPPDPVEPPKERPVAESAGKIASTLGVPPSSFGSAADGSAPGRARSPEASSGPRPEGAASQAVKPAPAVNPAALKRAPSWNFVAGGAFYNGYNNGASFGAFRRQPLVQLGSKGTLGADIGLVYSRSGGEKNPRTPDLSRYAEFTGMDPRTGAIAEVEARQRGARVFELAGGYWQSPTFKKRFSVETGVRAALIDSNPNFDIIQTVRTPMYYYGVPTYYYQEGKIATEPSPTGPRKFGPGYVAHAALNATLFKVAGLGVLGLRVEGAKIAPFSDKRAAGSRLSFGVSLTK